MDNTLFDWVNMWYVSFTAMLNKIVSISGIPASVLVPEIRTVFQKHGTSEYAFLIEEIPSLISKHPGENINQIYEEAIHAYRSARKSSLVLYPSVLETLQDLKRIGCILIAYTESMEFYSKMRIKKLGLDGLLDFVYSPADHSLPNELNRFYNDDYYKFNHTVHRILDTGEKKPNPRVLLNIIKNNDFVARAEETIYIGDSLLKDISMAKDAGIMDVYAKYGSSQNSDAYALLKQVTHWTDEEVRHEEMTLRNRKIIPTYILDKSFGQIFNFFDFISY